MIPGVPLVKKNSAFRALLYGQICSQLGDAVYMLAFLFAIQKLTNDPRLTGLTLALQAIPFLVLGPLAGLAADRLDRRRILISSDVACAVLVTGLAAVLALAPGITVPAIMVTGTLVSCANAFFLPARSAAIPQVVAPEELNDALGLMNAVFSAVTTAGNALAAFGLSLIARLDPANFFITVALINAASFIVSALIHARLPRLSPAKNPDPNEDQGWRAALEGFQFVKRDGFLRAALPAFALSSLLFAGFYPIYLKTNADWFGGEFETVAIIEFAFFASTFFGALLVARINPKRVGIAFLVGLYGACLTVAAMAYGQIYWIYVALNVVCGLLFPFSNIPVQTYIGVTVPDAVRGRVNALLTIILGGVSPIGTLLISSLIPILGLFTLYLVIGFGGIVAGAFVLFSRAARNARIQIPSPATD